MVGHFFQDTSSPALAHSSTYTYDALDRLGTSVATGSATHNLTFGYDRYGNMTCVVNGNTNGPCGVWSFNTSTNRITNANFTYDSSGNLTQDGTGVGTHTYQWDAEGRMKSVDSGTTATYTFNALDWRVEKKTGTSTFTEYIYTPHGIEADASDRTISCCAWEYLFLGSRRFGKYVSNVTRFIHQENLGSATTVTDYAGAVYQDKLYYPWGQQWALVGTEAETLFASLHTRDNETNLDPTHFRMFSSTEGRWFSPDPKAGCGMNPQNHNRYAYVANGPMNRVDPRGDQCTISDPSCSFCDLCNDDPSFADANSVDCDRSCGSGSGGGGGGGGVQPPCTPDYGGCARWMAYCDAVLVPVAVATCIVTYCKGDPTTACAEECAAVGATAGVAYCGVGAIACLIYTSMRDPFSGACNRAGTFSWPPFKITIPSKPPPGVPGLPPAPPRRTY